MFIHRSFKRELFPSQFDTGWIEQPFDQFLDRGFVSNAPTKTPRPPKHHCPIFRKDGQSHRRPFGHQFLDDDINLEDVPFGRYAVFWVYQSRSDGVRMWISGKDLSWPALRHNNPWLHRPTHLLSGHNAIPVVHLALATCGWAFSPSVGAQRHPRRSARSGHMWLEPLPPPPLCPVNILPTLTLGVNTEGYKIIGPASFCRTTKIFRRAFSRFDPIFKVRNDVTLICSKRSKICRGIDPDFTKSRTIILIRSKIEEQSSKVFRR